MLLRIAPDGSAPFSVSVTEISSEPSVSAPPSSEPAKPASASVICAPRLIVCSDADSPCVTAVAARSPNWSSTASTTTVAVTLSLTCTHGVVMSVAVAVKVVMPRSTSESGAPDTVTVRTTLAGVVPGVTVKRCVAGS